MARYRSLEDRLLANSVQDDAGCWLWTGATDKDGYPLICIRVSRPEKRHKRKSTAVRHKKTPQGFRAHRVAHELFKEVKLTPEETLEHKCYVRRCINPDHTYPVSQSVNTKLMWARKRTADAGLEVRF